MPGDRRNVSGWEDPIGAFVRWAVKSLRTSSGSISWTKAVAALFLLGFAVLGLTMSVVAFLLGLD